MTFAVPELAPIIGQMLSDRCELCPQANNFVPVHGPWDTDILFVGEAPGKDENRTLVPFSGKTGDEVNKHYLPLIGMRRDNCRFINTIMCLPNTNQGKIDLKKADHKALLESCATKHLYAEIERMRPKLIVAMGAFACYALDPNINLQLQHGFPIATKWGIVFAMFHPAGGIHEPKKMLQIRTDWIRLKRYLNGRLVIPEDEFAGREDYRHLQGADAVHAELWDRWSYPLAADTETTRHKKPFCLTFSTRPGTGYLIKSDDTPALEAFQYHVNRWRSIILFHNWLFDRRVTRAMNVVIPDKKVRDTMLIAFHLGNIPQGLKDLAYRELGMAMQDFEDLVLPHAIPLVLDYYERAREITWPKPEPDLIRDGKDNLWKVYKAQSLNTKLKRFFTDYGKNNEKDVFKMWTDNWSDQHKQMEEQLGEWPGKCITYAAEKDWPGVIRYAGRDADATLRLWPILNRMRSRVRRHPQESWRWAA